MGVIFLPLDAGTQTPAAAAPVRYGKLVLITFVQMGNVRHVSVIDYCLVLHVCADRFRLLRAARMRSFGVDIGKEAITRAVLNRSRTREVDLW